MNDSKIELDLGHEKQIIASVLGSLLDFVVLAKPVGKLPGALFDRRRGST